MIHLGTNFLIAALRRASREDQKLREWLEQGPAVGISAATAIRAGAELATGNIADFRGFERAGLRLAALGG